MLAAIESTSSNRASRIAGHSIRLIFCRKPMMQISMATTILALLIAGCAGNFSSGYYYEEPIDASHSSEFVFVSLENWPVSVVQVIRVDQKWVNTGPLAFENYDHAFQISPGEHDFLVRVSYSPFMANPRYSFIPLQAVIEKGKNYAVGGQTDGQKAQAWIEDAENGEIVAVGESLSEEQL
jgi:hypothetical protein